MYKGFITHVPWFMPWHFLGGQNGDLANNEFSWSYISHNISNELVAYHQKMGLEPSIFIIFIAQVRKKTQLKHSCSWNLGLGGGDLFCRADARFRKPRESAVDRGIRTGCLRRNWCTTSQPLTVCLEYIYVNRMIPVPDVIQLVFRIPCVLRLPAFQWHATEARSIFLVLGHLSQTLRLAVNPLKYNGECRYCIPV